MSKIVALVVGGRSYHYRTIRNDEWEQVPRRKLGKLSPEVVATVRLRRKVEVTVEVEGIGTIRVHLRLNPRYHLHVRWFVGNDMDGQNLEALVGHHVACWVDCALRNRTQQEKAKSAEWVERIRGRLGRMVLPGQIYKAVSIDIEKGPAKQ